jgi:hypothetical protein
LTRATSLSLLQIFLLEVQTTASHSLFDSLTPRPLPGPTVRGLAPPNTCRNRLFFQKVPSLCFFLDIFVVRFASIAFPLQDKFLHRRLEAVGMLCSLVFVFPHRVVPPFHSCVSRYFRSAFYRVFSSPSSHFVCFPHNTLLSLGRDEDTTSVTYCASGGFCMWFSVLLSGFSASVSMSISLYAFVFQLQIAFPKRDISGFRDSRSLEHGSDTNTMTSSPSPPIAYFKFIFLLASHRPWVWLYTENMTPCSLHPTRPQAIPR